MSKETMQFLQDCDQKKCIHLDYYSGYCGATMLYLKDLNKCPKEKENITTVSVKLH